VKRQHSLLGAMNMKLACMPGCVSPEVRLPLDQRICVLIVVKNVLWPAQEVVFVLHKSKICAYDQSYTFAQHAVQTARWS